MATGLASQGIGLGMQQGYNSWAMNEQVKHAKELTDYNYAKQLQMWKDTNYSAQTEQMRKAGLNIGLMYQGGGQGGSTNVATGSTPSGGSAQDWSGMGMQAANLMADLKLKEAQADNLKADAENKRGIERNESVARVEAITAGIKNTKAQTYAQEIQNSIYDATTEEQIEAIRYNCRKLKGEMQSAEAHGEIDGATKQERIN